MSKSPLSGEELAGWQNVLAFLDEQLVIEERVQKGMPRNPYVKGTLGATTAARDAVLKQVRKAQEAQNV